MRNKLTIGAVHGLHVSPADKSDNVDVMVAPGQTRQYEYRIDSDHPSGTFWYHPHAHGSSALQVDGGMAGALIVLDDPADLPRLLVVVCVCSRRYLAVFTVAHAARWRACAKSSC